MFDSLLPVSYGILSVATCLLGLSFNSSLTAWVLGAWPFNEFFARDDRSGLRVISGLLFLVGTVVLVAGFMLSL